MITFRQHVVTIISVFVALAVGVILGSGPFSEVAERTTEKPAVADRTDTRALEFGATFAEDVSPRLVDGVLEDQGVAIVTFAGADEDSVTSLTDLVGQAGGVVTGTYRLTEAFADPGQKSLVDTLGSQLLTQQEEGTVDSAASTYVRIGQLLGRSIAVPDADKVNDELPAFEGTTKANVQAMVGAELVEDPGTVESRASLVLVVLGDTPSAEGGDAITSGFLEGLDATALGVVVAGNSKDGDAGQLADLRAVAGLTEVATVDGVELAGGRAAAVLALAHVRSNEGGSFGASGSDGTVPVL
ncbi:MAG: copper transporter [Nocardioides sp.]|uniref:copper transporter n=1 Tax=Nocardioides sp. TaxID=35761 RepID=UPI003F0243B2